MRKGLLLLTAVLILAVSCQKKETESKETKNLVIYAYDSFVSDWGTGPVVIPKFEEKYGIKVDLRSPGDSGQMLTKAILEKNSPVADVIIGIDNNMLAKALKENILQPYKSENLKDVSSSLLFDESNCLTPYDYGFFSIIYDSKKITNPPESLEDLLSPGYENSIILMDPRTSSPGLGFLLWTVKVYGDSFHLILGRN